jgi:hypothetical protein
MPDMDMNENEVNQGVSIETLLQVIGLRDVEGFVRDQGIKKIQEQAAAMAAELSVLKSKKSESVPVSPELEQLRRSSKAADERVLQMENQVHEVALERDGFKAGKAEVVAELNKVRDDYTTLQRVCDGLQKKVDAIPVKKPKKK